MQYWKSSNTLRAMTYQKSFLNCVWGEKQAFLVPKALATILYFPPSLFQRESDPVKGNKESTMGYMKKTPKTPKE